MEINCLTKTENIPTVAQTLKGVGEIVNVLPIVQLESSLLAEDSESGKLNTTTFAIPMVTARMLKKMM